MTPEQWDMHYWEIRSDLHDLGVYAGDEETQRQIANDEATEQFGPRPQAAT